MKTTQRASIGRSLFSIYGPGAGMSSGVL